MRIIIVGLAITLAAACGTSSPVSPSSAGTADLSLQTGGARPGAGRASSPTIAGIAAGNPSFSTLVAALEKAGLVGVFDGRVHYTVFAPTNDAFDAAAAAFNLADGPALLAALDEATLTSILTYHVTRGDRNATSVVAAGSLLMLDGNTARVTANSGAVSIEGAAILATDIRASNGIVHVIDGVLLPPALRR